MADDPAGDKMAPTASEIALDLTELARSEPPKLDIDAYFILHQGNLAVLQEAQAVVADAVEAIGRAQFGYVERIIADAKAALTDKDLPTPETVLKAAKATLDQSVAVVREVTVLATDAQKRVGELLSRRVRANLDELTSFAW
jgi:hypothetical protein